jgi:hypothetical protein
MWHGLAGGTRDAANSPQAEIVDTPVKGACAPGRISIYTALTGGGARACVPPPIAS